jgi:hypothetical protein
MRDSFAITDKVQMDSNNKNLKAGISGRRLFFEMVLGSNQTYPPGNVVDVSDLIFGSFGLRKSFRICTQWRLTKDSHTRYPRICWITAI